MMDMYHGVQRQAGGGLGGIFRILTRTILPAIAKTARPFIQKQARKALPKLAEAGIGLVSDLQRKRNFKQAVKARGKRLASDVMGNVLNDATKPTKRQKRARRQTRQTSNFRGSRNRSKKSTPRDVFS